MEILNNPWVIGIGGGILSGLVVTLVTRNLFSRRDNREYAQRTVTARQEILYAVRPGISEGVIPSRDVVRALTAATASKYSVDPEDLYSVNTLVDVLVKEIMDTSFLSASVKAEFCMKLRDLRRTEPIDIQLTEQGDAAPRSTPELAEYRRRMVRMMSAVLGVVAAMVSGMTSVLAGTWAAGASLESFRKPLLVLFPAITTIMVASAASYWTLVGRSRRHARHPHDARGEGQIEEVEHTTDTTT